mmetsp:Transcript_9723/g.31275  ORF Transcript_9723/g.31275 Transcript_9723/m.31275 type:complete len:365 (+) Transcript_9723:803-1897(+)
MASGLRPVHMANVWTHDLVLTRCREDLSWATPYAQRSGWRMFIYNTCSRAKLPRLCSDGGTQRVTCTHLPNVGYEWHGYLRHLIDQYEQLAPTTIFLQGNPLTVSPDIHCLLNASAAHAPIQVLSWVQMSKTKAQLFSSCTSSHIGPCRVYVEPVTTGLRPMLHGDRWLMNACRMAKRFKGHLFQFLFSQLAGDPALASGTADQHVRLMTSTPVPDQIYRAYGSQFSAARAELRRRPRPFYERLLRWLITDHDAMHTAGFLNMWRAYTSKEKAILLELAWMALLGAERHVPADVCSACLPLARSLPRPPGAVGASCIAEYYSGAPRVEECNITGDGWGGRGGACGQHCGRLGASCRVTKNMGEA